jgi:hypothetical protein
LLVAQSSVARKKKSCLSAFIDFSKAYDGCIGEGGTVAVP